MDAALVGGQVRDPGPEAEGDARLVARAVRGEVGAFGQLYQRHVDAVFHYVHFRVRDVGQAEDLTQEVFINALKGIVDLRDHGRFRQWLFRIAHRQVLNHWRSLGSRPRVADPLPGEDPDDRLDRIARSPEPTVPIDERCAAEDVLAATARLTDLQQQVIALRFVGGLSVGEAAAAMDRTENAVKNLQHHALAALRRHLNAAELES